MSFNAKSYLTKLQKKSKASIVLWCSHLEDIGTDWRIILKRILKKEDVDSISRDGLPGGLLFMTIDK
jgi:hypothetical protein